MREVSLHVGLIDVPIQEFLIKTALPALRAVTGQILAVSFIDETLVITSQTWEEVQEMMKNAEKV
jgi:hypothetical protein